MYELCPANRKVERELNRLIKFRKDIAEKLRKLAEDPRRNVGVAHPLYGRLAGGLVRI